jgi:hypothetical protein
VLNLTDESRSDELDESDIYSPPESKSTDLNSSSNRDGDDLTSVNDLEEVSQVLLDSDKDSDAGDRMPVVPDIVDADNNLNPGPSPDTQDCDRCIVQVTKKKVVRTTPHSACNLHVLTGIHCHRRLRKET